ncbi:AraC family transcriptional regulator, partial [Clostridium perfringens]
MKWNHFKSKLLLKYTLSYISIFLIPLVILTIIIYHNAVNTLRSEIEQTNVNQLTQAKIVIDERMKELQDIAFRIAYDEQLTRYWTHHP